MPLGDFPGEGDFLVRSTELGGFDITSRNPAGGGGGGGGGAELALLMPLL